MFVPTHESLPPSFVLFSIKRNSEIFGRVTRDCTVILKVACTDEFELVAVIVYVTAAAPDVGVPVIRPVAVSKLKPFPIAGEIE